MPAKDKYHDTVVNALQKDGWTIDTEQYLLIVENRLLWIDLHATNLQMQRAILIEIKSFLSASQVDDIANAIGKYVMYRAIIEQKNIDLELYLAIPRQAFDGIFSEKLGTLLREKLNILLLVFDIDSEEIIEWRQ